MLKTEFTLITTFAQGTFYVEIGLHKSNNFIGLKKKTHIHDFCGHHRYR